MFRQEAVNIFPSGEQASRPSPKGKRGKQTVKQDIPAWRVHTLVNRAVQDLTFYSRYEEHKEIAVRKAIIQLFNACKMTDASEFENDDVHLILTKLIDRYEKEHKVKVAAFANAERAKFEVSRDMEPPFCNSVFEFSAISIIERQFPDLYTFVLAVFGCFSPFITSMADSAFHEMAHNTLEEEPEEIEDYESHKADVDAYESRAEGSLWAFEQAYRLNPFTVTQLQSYCKTLPAGMITKYDLSPIIKAISQCVDIDMKRIRTDRGEEYAIPAEDLMGLVINRNDMVTCQWVEHLNCYAGDYVIAPITECISTLDPNKFIYKQEHFNAIFKTLAELESLVDQETISKWKD
jgi:hypothetical protein